MAHNSLYIFCLFVFKEQFQVHGKVERKVQEFPIYPLPPHMHSLPHYQHPPSEWYIVIIDGPILTHHNHPKSNSLHSGSLLVLYNLWIWTNVYTCVCHYGIIQSIFTDLKILSALSSHCSPLLQPLVSTNLITVSVVLPFPECHIVESYCI